ncbi:hypothetical protein [Gorillibacterium timonense]|uniref:hypothetical protein n=1 Tax=Gorillibacterium timonense TaxID=1689269 RepID=UPI00071CFE40|nr:hypothetical protein [Gorillibacterium timonense]
MIQILEEPVGEAYRSLISLAFKICDELILVKRDQLPLNESGQDLITQLRPYTRIIRKQESWPGTALFGHFADVYYLPCTEMVKDILLSRTTGLYDWLQPDLLEDLCFYKNQSEWLVTVSHEKRGYLNIEDRSEILELREIEELLFY